MGALFGAHRPFPALLSTSSCALLPPQNIALLHGPTHAPGPPAYAFCFAPESPIPSALPPSPLLHAQLTLRDEPPEAPRPRLSTPVPACCPQAHDGEGTARAPKAGLSSSPLLPPFCRFSLPHHGFLPLPALVSPVSITLYDVSPCLHGTHFKIISPTCCPCFFSRMLSLSHSKKALISIMP